MSTLSAGSQTHSQWLAKVISRHLICDFEGQNLKVQLSVRVGELRIAAQPK